MRVSLKTSCTPDTAGKGDQLGAPLRVSAEDSPSQLSWDFSFPLREIKAGRQTGRERLATASILVWEVSLPLRTWNSPPPPQGGHYLQKGHGYKWPSPGKCLWPCGPELLLREATQRHKQVGGIGKRDPAIESNTFWEGFLCVGSRLAFPTQSLWGSWGKGQPRPVISLSHHGRHRAAWLRETPFTPSWSTSRDQWEPSGTR